MRCEHCFVGNDLLDTSRDLPFETLETTLRIASSEWLTREITYLGGEPTLYPRIKEVLDLTASLGIHPRIVSNGGSSLVRLLARLNSKIHVAVSIDGATALVHDKVRQSGSYVKAVAALRQARDSGHTTSATMSVGKHNIGDVIQVAHLAEDLGLEHLNIHFVTDRGNACSSQVASAEEWAELRDGLRSLTLKTKVRFERGFIPLSERINCLVGQSMGSMMLPDGRILACPMYLHIKEGHSHMVDGGRIIQNAMFVDRNLAVATMPTGCPTVHRISPSAARQASLNGMAFGCMFDKEQITGPSSLAIWKGGSSSDK